ncbi:BON domain-containing protein [Flavobacterium algicola]|uniref:BON domain-containing protein n=1 Tax=Flavobacterium algicola TaxID=556529 RepID=UPI001EFEA9E4|nr:BON domain-containing protein [Flavobacterium algicola]MCG9792191.1 BON domain-containing protein [Flavobacterium algicola]
MKNNGQLNLNGSQNITWKNLPFTTEVAQKTIVQNSGKIVDSFSAAITKSDDILANEVLRALKLNHWIPDALLNLEVKNGWITLKGELSCNCQVEATQKVLEGISGIADVTNCITIKLKSNDEIQRSYIEKAIATAFSQLHNAIKVKVTETAATLTGTVSSWNQKEEIGRIAWNTEGIWIVKNEIQISTNQIF